MNDAYISPAEFLANIGKVITRLRIRLNLRQENMATELGMTQPALSKYENGKTDIPVLKLKEISDKYDFPITDFFIEEELPSKVYKKIVRVPACNNTDEYDKEFDRYILAPEHRDKKNVLNAASILIENNLLSQTEKKRLLKYVEMPAKNDTLEQRKRLDAYCKFMIEQQYFQKQAKPK